MAIRQLDLFGLEEVVPDIFYDQMDEGKFRIAKIREEISKLKQEETEIIERNVHLCNHPLSELFELPYIKSDYFNSEPSWIICRKCGLTERGWGIGHVALAHGAYKKLPKIDRKQWAEWATIRIFEKDKKNWRKNET